ncbi:stage III sporulation protein AF [Seinonella peptonophila]|uniref:Stage III sporulation protein AF n=1 Tax=Seinonella peptonophila TaxID=112248 RepID=A0A1M4TN00_9BACL|nr:stage III sporulation protein AF [Seinonella peptonophila]SHE45744.1 stage III sporulation protein AF [Seinonella peptonophila]
MEWISDWLKQIILLVLIATFIDLLLPQQSLSRYVKLVLGLLIILAILQPILQLLTDQLSVDQLLKGDQNASKEAAIPSIATIQRQAEEIKSNQQHEWIKTWKSNFEQQLKKLLDQRYPQLVRQIEISVEWKDQQPHLNQILFILRNPNSTNQKVDPIQIDPFIQRDNVEQKRNQQHLKDLIQKDLQQFWGIDPKKVQMEFE